MNKNTLLGVLLSGLITTAMANPPSKITLPDEFDQVLRDYEREWIEKDATGLSELFAENGFVMPHGHPPVNGRAAIADFYKDAGGPLALSAYAYREQGDVAYILGGVAFQKGEPELAKFTLTLLKVQGRWMIFSDMDNGNRRPKRKG